jgi:hypothetical protein
MREDQLVLHFETLPGRYPDTAIAARALLDWVDLVQNTVKAISPNEQLIIQIVGVKEGSSRFPQLLKWLDDQTGAIRQAWDSYPHLKTIIVGSAHTLFTAAVAAGVTQMMQPRVEIVRLSDEDRQILSPLQERAAANPAVQTASKRFYRTVESDPAITGVGVAANWSAKPSVIVPRAEFAERGGLWEMEEDAPPHRIQRDTWDVVLLRPNLVSKPQPWQFSRDGLKFSAQMADANFLVALRDARVALNMQEGLMMRVEIEYKETENGQIWEADSRSRRIVRVLWPVPVPKFAPQNPRQK